jgi:hypothetical protein
MVLILTTKTKETFFCLFAQASRWWYSSLRNREQKSKVRPQRPASYLYKVWTLREAQVLEIGECCELNHGGEQVSPPTAASVSADPRLEKVIGAIMARGVNYSAADVYDGFARLNELCGSGRVELAKV